MEVPYVTFPSKKNALTWAKQIKEVISSETRDDFSKLVFNTEPRCVSNDGVVRLTETVMKFTRQPFQVSIFGSARMGISLSPVKPQLFQPFGSESDLDVVLFSNDFFNELQVTHLNALSVAGTWRLKSSEDEFYISRGWYRPDKHPRARVLFEIASAIQQEVFHRRIKCAVALFRDKLHYSAYLRFAHEQLRTSLNTKIERDLP